MMFNVIFHSHEKKVESRVVVIDASTEDDATEWGSKQAAQWKHTGAVTVELADENE